MKYVRHDYGRAALLSITTVVTVLSCPGEKNRYSREEQRQREQYISCRRHMRARPSPWDAPPLPISTMTNGGLESARSLHREASGARSFR